MTDTPTPPTDAPTPEDHPGAVLGPYTLVELLGEGGFGTVWIAQQQRPVRRRVALKIVKAGMGSRDVLARFDAERQALAVMDHAGVAKVLDAGTTPGGRPYFAMELVDGMPLVHFADHATLDLPARLRLMLAVCQAVQHAHQKGIVHRDLKPDNVLVSDDQGRPVPRVIDFGIAKALTAPLTDSSLQTGVHQVMGTPAYMAPEQALRSADVDTRADVYSLGALLYELLCGARPFQFDTSKTTLVDVLRCIQEVDPVPPSQRLAQHEHQHLRGVAAWRGTTPERLEKQLRGDLDWIVMRALEKDRERRYPTVAALADDLQRHLAYEPVEAGPPSTVYRLGKLVKRHRGASVGAAAALLALFGAVTVLAWSVDRVAEERDTAREAQALEAEARSAAEDALAASTEVTSYLKDMLGQASPAASGLGVTVREVLDRVGPSVGPRFVDRPVVEAELREIVGGTYTALGVPHLAREHLERALMLDTALHGGDHLETLAIEQQLALIDWMESRNDQALSRIRDVRERLVDLLGEDADPSYEALNIEAIVLDEMGDSQAALEMWQRVLSWRLEHRGPGDPGTLSARQNVAMVQSRLGLWAEAEAGMQSCIDAFRDTLGDLHPDTLAAWNNLIMHRHDIGEHQRALEPAQELLAIRRRLLGDDHYETIGSIGNLAAIRFGLDHHTEALELAHEAERRGRRVLGEYADTTLLAREVLGNSYAALERFDEAEPYTVAVYDARIARQGPDHPGSLLALQNLCALLRSQGRPAEADEKLEELVERSARVFGPSHERSLRARYLLQNNRHIAGNAAGVSAPLQALLEDCLDALGPDAALTVDVEAELAWCLIERALWDEAEEHFWAVYEARAERLGPDHPLTTNALEGLSSVYRDAGRENELASVSRLLLAATRRRAERPDAIPHDMCQLAWYLCAGPLPDAYDPPEAVRWAEKGSAAAGGRVTRYLDILASARHADGDLQGAIEAHQSAVELLPLIDPHRRHHEARIAALQHELAGDRG